ncbi:hypothetical protein Tsubulata_004737 [Turnera subulata]|uniref:DUF1421 domain-containing protein n=1 Tax=Turnera subulata TaxID=218843 RepID=A0A9Q0FHD3_9ROSI|nr:hypothetical protein Tsubulata_004737 [Turnera subulata]
MNTSQFMDKQIMDLTSPSHQSLGSSSPKHSTKDFIDLMNPPQDDDVQHQHHNHNHYNGINREDILPSYDFQPIRPLDSSSTTTAAAAVGSPTVRSWNSADLKSNSFATATASRSYGSLDSVNAANAKVAAEKDRGRFDAVMVAEIDKIMKHVDTVLHAVDGVSARLSQLETRTRNLENSLDDLKLAVENGHGSSDGKMRHLENILTEVLAGVQVVKDKQEIMGAQLQLAKLQASKGDQQQSETQNIGHKDAVQQAASAPPQTHQQVPPVTFPQLVPPAPVPSSAVPTPPFPQQNMPPAAPVPNQFPPNQIPSVPQRETYYPPPGQNQEPPNPQYPVPQPQHAQPSPAAPPQQPYPPAPQIPYSQPPQPSQSQTSLGHHPEETSYIPPQSYPPSLRPPSSQPPSGAPPQPYYGAPPHAYEPPSSRPSSGFSGGYGPPTVPSEPYSYGGPSSQYGSSPATKPQQLSSPAMPHQGSGRGYPQLPTARILPQALPTASGVGSGSGSPGSGNRVPLDDVIDKVTTMGFPREHVRATVRKLTENGQSVDLNVVLDKLMNDGDVQPQRGWFGR